MLHGGEENWQDQEEEVVVVLLLAHAHRK